MVGSKFFGQYIVGRKDVAVAFLLVNALTSYYMLISIIGLLQENLGLTNFESIAIWAFYCIAIVGFSLAGTLLAERFQRQSILYLWSIFGVLTSLTLAFFENVTLVGIIVFSFLSGASFGLGMPSCLALFAQAFSVEKRGSVGGIILLLTNLFASLVMLSSDSFNPIMYSLILAAWRMFSLVVAFASKLERTEAPLTVEKQLSFSNVLREKSFVLYAIPWVLFCIINRLGTPIVQPLLEKSLEGVPPMIEPLVGSVSTIIGGLLADKIGRKKVVIYGFVSLGVAFAIIGIAPQIPLASFFFVLINAVSAGFLWVMFILTIWGDLSSKGNSEKYYALGNIPFFVTWGILQLLSTQYLMLIEAYTVFSFASFFLFLAVIPLMYASETLPEKQIRERELRQYIEKAKKTKEKHT